MKKGKAEITEFLKKNKVSRLIINIVVMGIASIVAGWYVIDEFLVMIERWLLVDFLFLGALLGIFMGVAIVAEMNIMALLGKIKEQKKICNDKV